MNKGRPIRITHIITGLNTGGAETVLYRLLKYQRHVCPSSQIISLTDIGPVGDKIRRLGIDVAGLGMRRGVANPVFVWRLVKMIKDFRSDIVQTWMYHANLIGGIASSIAGVPVVWNIRGSDRDSALVKRTTLWTISMGARLSRFIPKKIICVSESARRICVESGYDTAKLQVIHNGIDVDCYKPDRSAGAALRAALGLPPPALLVGLIARFDPQKDHRSFVQAMKIVLDVVPDCHAILCGDDCDEQNTQLMQWIHEAGRPQNFQLLGRRDDMPFVQAALDVVVMSSAYGEGFPNVIAEAMSCGVPTVVTRVGDAELIVGSTGLAVDKSDPSALGEAIAQILSKKQSERHALGIEARRRIVEYFSIQKMIDAYKGIYVEIRN